MYSLYIAILLEYIPALDLILQDGMEGWMYGRLIETDELGRIHASPKPYGLCAVQTYISPGDFFFFSPQTGFTFMHGYDDLDPSLEGVVYTTANFRVFLPHTVVSMQ